MSKFRTCKASRLNTGGSACPIDWGKVKGAILVEHGKKLTELDEASPAEKLLAACHADGASRIYPIGTFVEYAREGGEVQTNAVGYGGTKITGISARNDTYTLDVPNEALNATLLASKSKQWDAYFYDENNVIYGQRDDDGSLAGIPMQCVYSNLSEHPTSGDPASHTVTFCMKDAEKYLKNIAYVQCDFDLEDALIGLTPVELVEMTSGNYKILEEFGSYDRTEEIVSGVNAGDLVDMFNDATTVSFNSGTNVLAITGSGVVSIKSPSYLFTSGIATGVEYIRTV